MLGDLLALLIVAAVMGPVVWWAGLHQPGPAYDWPVWSYRIVLWWRGRRAERAVTYRAALRPFPGETGAQWAHRRTRDVS